LAVGVVAIGPGGGAAGIRCYLMPVLICGPHSSGAIFMPVPVRFVGLWVCVWSNLMTVLV
jgi:hypothetical protein